MKNLSHTLAFIAVSLLGYAMAPPASAEDYDRVLRLDHYVGVQSTVPAITGQRTPIYVREAVKPASALRDRSIANRVVLFIHGAGTPAEVAFDVPYEDYSWMEYLAQAGFDTFAMDTTGYGRSTRPAAMNDPCNLSAAQQVVLAPDGRTEACPPSYGQNMTTIASDWNDIGAVVDHLRALRGASQVSMVSWSLGGPRAAGYAAQNPDKVSKLVLLAPAYSRDASATPPTQVPAPGAAMNTQSRDELTALWNRQVGCPEQYEQDVFKAVWQAMLDSDPVGATWGPGVRRAPNVTNWGWTTAIVAATKIPTLMVTGAHDGQVQPSRVHDLYADLGAKSKVLIDLACSSHNAMWEKNHRLLFQASLDWLTKGSVNGVDQGKVRLGY
ncbi:MAG TPA: alpha/beta fold hydrolase [Xanthobacteraceae bacterium]|nr:alpha/beta fold hydrolase [Xanthobacteraceae bacterium]